MYQKKAEKCNGRRGGLPIIPVFCLKSPSGPMNVRVMVPLVWLLVACQPDKKPVAETKSPPTPPSDSLVLDLAALKTAGAFSRPQPVTVTEDPVYHQRKTYEAVPLPDVLRKLPHFARADRATTQVVFECADGYNPSMPLATVLRHRAFLAVRDVETPAGQEWIPARKGDQTKLVAPFYVVYTDVPPTDETVKWPYNLVRIRLKAAADELARLHPTGTPERGYALFRTHCNTCHAVNGVGGEMGPELNFPKNITEYWQERDLRAFVRNPASYRHGVKMPAITPQQVSDADLGEIIGYLRFMAGHKLPSPGN